MSRVMGSPSHRSTNANEVQVGLQQMGGVKLRFEAKEPLVSIPPNRECSAGPRDGTVSFSGN